jgi:hypothetical protein
MADIIEWQIADNSLQVAPSARKPLEEEKKWINGIPLRSETESRFSNNE